MILFFGDIFDLILQQHGEENPSPSPEQILADLEDMIESGEISTDEIGLWLLDQARHER